MLSATVMERASLEEVYIFFDTATYDEIERDVKNSLEDQLGLLGGTLGLFTGFSILSGVEIVYFLLRFLRISLTTIQSLSKSTFIVQVLHVTQDSQN